MGRMLVKKLFLILIIALFLFYSFCTPKVYAYEKDDIIEQKEQIENLERNLDNLKVDRKDFEALKEQLKREDKEAESKKQEREKNQLKQSEQLESEKAEELSSLEQIFGGATTFKVSRNISQFGYNIFTTPSSTFAPVENVPVGPDYLIGSGDSLIIYIWGKVVQETFNVTVDRDGKINLPRAGNIYVWGLKFEEVEKVVKNTLSEHYANLQISITMGRLRTIKVFVLGEVQKPGAYTVSSLSTVFHAIYETGGPTKLGSMRKIKLIRNNETKSVIDLYQFLLKGDKSQDYKLQSNDTIFVPPIGPVAGITGSVKRPAIYELRDPIKISDLIKMSGGLTPISSFQRIQLERIKDHERKVVMDLQIKDISEFESSDQNIELQDGDFVFIFPILPLKYNYVTISGNVLRSGDYELEQGMRVNDLIEKAGGIVSETYLERAEIFRYKDDKTKEIIPINLKTLFKYPDEENIFLQEWDELRIYSKTDVIPVQYVEISGAVYKPGKFELTPNMKLNDLMFRAGGVKPTAFLENAELFRLGQNEPSKVITVDLSRVLDADYPAHNLLLKAGDHFYVRDRVELSEKRIVVVKGAVKFPGEYVAGKDERLSSIIERAGGFTEEAFLKGTVFTRESIRQAQAKMINRFVQSEQRELLRNEAMLVRTNASEEEIKEKQLVFQRRKELLRFISSIEVLGRMIIHLDELYKFAGSKSDIKVEHGDTLYIPETPSTVQIIGSVYNPTSLIYKKGKNADYYLNKVGGLTKYADKKGIYIVKANGEVTTEFARIHEIERGDAIIVPEEFKTKTEWRKVWLDVTQIIYHTAVGAAVVMD